MIGVVKLGGAFFSDPSKKYVEKLQNFVKSFRGKLAFVAGGGRNTKEYLNKLREFDFPEGFLDYIGIELTHVNARILAKILNGTYCRTFWEVDKNITKLPVTGGQIPGQSTDAVAAELADFLGADLLILVKDVGGIYTSNPKEDPGARLIHRMRFEDLEKFLDKKTKAGYYGVVDPQAILIITRMRIPTYIVGIDFDFERGTTIGEEL